MCLELQGTPPSYIKTGRRSQLDPDGTRYIDTLSFWRDSHQRQQIELKDLKRQVHSLKDQVNARQDKGKLDAMQPNAEEVLALPVITARGKKRKRGEEDEPAKSCTKDTLDVVRNGPYEVGLTGAIYELHKWVSSSAPVSLNIARTIISAVALARQWATHAEAALSASERLDNATIGPTVFTILFTAIAKLGTRSEMREAQAQSVYLMVELLKDLLGQVCEVAAKRVNSNQDRRRSARSKQQVNCEVPNMSQDGTLECLCRTIQHALQGMSLARETDKAIRDGYMCFLLRRIGKVLNVFVFGEDDEKWKSSSTQVEAGVKPRTGQNATRREKKAIHEAQAPYLIWLLERSIVCLTDESGARSSKGLSSKATKNLPVKGQDSLSDKVMLQLQSTMLKEVLGQDLIEFVDALKEAEDHGIAIEPWSALKQIDIADFFKSEVWRLVGWDRLKDHLK
ncbi:MAG: hypothetical protein Q9183_003216 [Haloplaca sp. 2 TL-2023]